jgi:multidrug transporter EmrE-like cation transporter
VLTLSGVLKDILLVIASMVIFRDPVTPTQFAGYSIALGGLVYYKVGAGKLSEYVAQSRITWSQFTAKNPASGKVIVFCMALLVLSLMLAGLSPYVSDAYKSGVLDKMKSIGDKTSTP